MPEPIITLLIPDYKTLVLTKLCLRLFKKYTDMFKVHIIVIANDSQDESILYLRSLSWIELIERKGILSENGATSYSNSFDLTLERVKKNWKRVQANQFRWEIKSEFS